MDELNQTTTSEGEQKLPVKEATAEPKEAQEVASGTKIEKTETQPAAEKTTFTKEDFEKELEQRLATVKGGHEGTVKKMRADIAAREQQLSDIQSKMEELQFAQLLGKVEAEGGDMNAARQVVELQKQVIAQKRAIEAERRQIAEEKETLSAERQVVEAAGKVKKAHELILEHGLNEKTDLPKLLEAKDPMEMELKALRIAVIKTKSEGVKTTKVDAPGTSSKGVDLEELKKQSFSTALGMAAKGKI